VNKLFVQSFKNLRDCKFCDTNDDYLVFAKENIIVLINIESKNMELIEYSSNLKQILIWNDSMHLLAASKMSIVLFRREDKAILYERDINRVLKQSEDTNVSHDCFYDEDFLIFHSLYEKGPKTIKIQ
jgi:hypothetical protein